MLPSLMSVALKLDAEWLAAIAVTRQKEQAMRDRRAASLCVDCGAPVRKPKAGPCPLRCPKHRREHWNKERRSYYEANKEEIKRKRKARRQTQLAADPEGTKQKEREWSAETYRRTKAVSADSKRS